MITPERQQRGERIGGQSMAGNRRRRSAPLPARLALLSFLCFLCVSDGVSAERPKLYWFVPDGMRADPDTFNIYRWADEGKLPNIKRMMERGSYGYCKPAFPSHTPANFATLFTGAYPEVHGVNDGPMRLEGNPLGQVSISGFHSAAKKVEPIWVSVEKALRCDITLLSVPGSTPPELKRGNTIRGRWGQWGADFHAVNFQDALDDFVKKLDRNSTRLFYVGAPLTQLIEKRPAAGWSPLPKSFSPPLEAPLVAWGATWHACLLDTTDNGQADYDTIRFSTDKTNALCSLKSGAWSDWLPIRLRWQIPKQNLSRDVDTQVRIKLIKLETNGLFRVRFLYNNLNKFLSEPDHLAAELVKGVGPMVDFADNFPAQLIYCPEDKTTFLEEAELSLDWHRDAAGFVLKNYQPDVFIQNIYTPNQMLTTRWWMGYVDPKSARYRDVSDAHREKLWQEVHWLYRKLDDIIGRMLDGAPINATIVLSSDHGAVPLDTQVRLNNLFAREGLLKSKTDANTGAHSVDWEQTKAVYLQMQSVYLNPAGLGGNWKRASGPEFEQLRSRVKNLLLGLTDPNGIKPVEKIVERERVAQELRLQPERTGDLVIANRAGFGWSEEVTDDLAVFATPLITGYKQAILAEKAKGLWTPFIIVGPGIRAGNFLGEKPIEMVDQYPTLLHQLGMEQSPWVQGRVVSEALQPR